MAGVNVERVRFPAQEARLVRADPDADATDLVAALGLSARGPVIVLNGGTEALPAATAASLATAMASVVTVAVQLEASLVTGATDAGVFSLLGEALARRDGGYVCLGVAPAALTSWPGKTAAPGESAANGADAVIPLEPHHTHFVAVETAAWGGETPLMMDVVATLSAGLPTAAVLAGGGEVAAREVQAHLEARRPIIVLAGSGRLADQLAGIAQGTAAPTGGMAVLAASAELLHAWEPSEGPARLEAILRRCLAEG